MSRIEGPRRFGRAELVRFLVAVDQHLTEAAEIILIGGGAAAVAYGVDTGTHPVRTRASRSTASREAARPHARLPVAAWGPRHRAGHPVR
jgi:hypothetical protein